MNYLVEQATKTPDGRFAYLAPLYRQVKQAAWDALKAAAPGVEFSESELQARFPNGARIQLFGADNYEALRGMHLDGVGIDEFGDIKPAAWDAVIRPALAVKQGFAVFIGTPKGRNHFYELFARAEADPAWFTALYRYQDSGVLSDEEIDLARRQTTPEHFAQEYECSFEAAISGAYYAPQFGEARANGRFRELVWEPTIPVDTWWDLGFTDATAIIFTQTVAREIRVLDYLETSGQDLAYYVKALAAKPYIYGTHHLPHDAGYKTQAGAGVPMDAQLKRLGLGKTRVHGKTEVLHGINAARLLWPRCWFDAVKCERLLTCLASYHPKSEDSREPEHDEFSHGADAFRLLALGHRDGEQRSPLRRLDTKAQPRAYDTTYNPWDRTGSDRQRVALMGGTAWDVGR